MDIKVERKPVRGWVAPKLDKLGTMKDVAATGSGTGETNPGGQVKFLAS